MVLCLRSNNHYSPALACTFDCKDNLAGDLGKQGVILAHADVAARVPLRAALTNDDVAGARLLAAKELHAQALAFTVATVAAGTACFFMCHDVLLPESRKPVITWP